MYRVDHAELAMYRSDDTLLLLLQVLGELSASAVVPDEVRVLRVAVQCLQQLQKSQSVY